MILMGTRRIADISVVYTYSLQVRSRYSFLPFDLFLFFKKMEIEVKACWFCMEYV
jgi:hypothetical protein